MVPIIIPFYREQEKLRNCLAAIAAQSHRDCEVFVRDNTHDNILWTAAINEGLAKYGWRPEVDYMLLLNQDAYVDPDCVAQLVAFMDAHPDCGVACPLQYELEPSGARRVTWGGSLQCYPTGMHKTGPIESYSAPFETYWANGACMMVRSQTVREVGLFDKNMRFICSDADFSFTARSRGWKIYGVPQARCRHALDASGRAGNKAIELVKLRDTAYFLDKWLTGGVYRRIALEGPTLAATTVRRGRAILAQEIALMALQAGERARSAQDDYPSWNTAMHIPAPPVPQKP